jgi:hypothetical protein
MNAEQRKEVSSLSYDKAKIIKDNFLLHFGHRLLKVSNTDNNIMLDLITFILENIIREIERAEKETIRSSLPAFPIISETMKRRWELEGAKELAEKILTKIKNEIPEKSDKGVYLDVIQIIKNEYLK